jgi:hypothetical protein
MPKLFSYGTLQDPKVQLTTFGRLLNGKTEILYGYKLSLIKITDPEIIKISGKEFHPTLIFSGKKIDEVSGVLFDITEAELLDCDSYEKQYKRVLVKFKSGVQGFVYVTYDPL